MGHARGGRSRSTRSPNRAINALQPRHGPRVPPATISGDGAAPTAAPVRKKRHLSAAVRNLIAEAARRRWAALEGSDGDSEKGSSPDQGGGAKGDERCGQGGGGGWEPQYRHRLIGAINGLPPRGAAGRQQRPSPATVLLAPYRRSRRSASSARRPAAPLLRRRSEDGPRPAPRMHLRKRLLAGSARRRERR